MLGRCTAASECILIHGQNNHTREWSGVVFKSCMVDSECKGSESKKTQVISWLAGEERVREELAV